MISEEYRDVLRATHEAYPVWGNGHGARNLPLVKAIHRTGESVLDYGCGKGTLVDALRAEGIVAYGYDPAVERFELVPVLGADLLVSFDVLEHIEPDHLASTLDHMWGLAPRALLNISLVPAKKLLTDGRNAHLIVEPADWWMGQLEQRYGDGIRLRESHKEVTFLCSR